MGMEISWARLGARGPWLPHEAGPLGSSLLEKHIPGVDLTTCET